MSAAIARELRRTVPGLLEPQPLERAQTLRRWRLDALAGRIIELSAQGGALLTPALLLVREAQTAGEPVAWVAAAGQGLFFPPDAVDCGVDLAALVVVRVPDGPASGPAAGRAAERLTRCGAFGLIVLDLGAGAALSDPLQGRLLQQVQQHDTALLCLTDKPAHAPSLGSLVSLRGEVTRIREADGRFACTLHMLKDKRGGGGWEHREVCHGTPGLR